MRPIANKWLLVILAFSLINSYQLLFAADSFGPFYWQGYEKQVLKDVQNGSLETANTSRVSSAHWEFKTENIITKSFDWEISGPPALISAGFGGSTSGTHTCSYSLSSDVPPVHESIEGNPVNWHQAFVAYHGRPTEEYEKWRYYYMPEYEFEYIISSATYLDKAYVSQNYWMTGNMQALKDSRQNYPCAADTYQRTNPFIYLAETDWQEPEVDINIEELGSIESLTVTQRDFDN